MRKGNKRKYISRLIIAFIVLLSVGCNGKKEDVFHEVHFVIGEETTVEKVKEGEMVKQPLNPEVEGFRFTAWYNEKGYEYNFDEPIKEDIVLTAKLYDSSSPLVMIIEDAFNITGLNNDGMAVSGMIERGQVKLNDVVTVIGLGGEPIETTVYDITTVHEFKDMAMAGDKVGLHLTNITKEQVAVGRAVITPNSIQANRRYTVEIEGNKGIKEEKIENITWEYQTLTLELETIITTATTIKAKETIEAEMVLKQNMVLYEGMEIDIKSNGMKIGICKIKEVKE